MTDTLKVHKSKLRPDSPRPSDDTTGPRLSHYTLNIPGSGLALHKSGSDISKTHSDRVKKLLIALAYHDSLYLCPITQPLPQPVVGRLSSVPVRKYEIRDYNGQIRFYAVELTKPCNYRFCSNNRNFEVVMYFPDGEKIFECVRSYHTCLCLCGVDCCCCVANVETAANYPHEENFIGSVLTRGNFASPTFIVQNDEWDETFYIRGPTCGHLLPCRLCRIHHFSICKPRTAVSLGKIMYGYDGLTDELIPNPQTVGVIFPPRCSPETKALLLAAGFMLDITYFENRGCKFHRIMRQILILFYCGLIVLLLFLVYKNDPTWFSI